MCCQSPTRWLIKAKRKLRVEKVFGNWPQQLLVVVFGTLFSYLFEFDEKYGVDIVGNITTE